MEIKISKPLHFIQQGFKDNQEDRLFPAENQATEDTRVFLVCDGMGGHEKGEVASQTVSSVVGGFTSGNEDISCEELKGLFANGLAKAYAELDRLDTSDSIKKMGTTLTYLGICNDGVFVAHIGDSRIYQFRPGKGIVFQTRDHSLVNDLISAGELTEEEAILHPQRNVITRAVMPHQEYPSRATVKVLTDIQPGDIFMMCSDGVVERHSNGEIQQMLLGEGSLEECVDKLRQSCTDCKTHDNNTAYVFEVVDVVDETAVPVVVTDADESTNVNEEINTDENMENEKNTENSSGSKGNVIMAIVLVAVIVFSLGYMAFGGSKHEGMRDPDKTKANATLLDEDTTGYDEETLVQEGLPEEQKSEESKEVKETTTTTTAAVDRPATTSTSSSMNTPSAPANDGDLPDFGGDDISAPEPAAPAPEPAAPAVEQPKIKSTKIVEDVKEGPSEQATISE